MISKNTLNNMMFIGEDELESMKVDDLRTILGVFHFVSRVIERKINEKETK